MQAEVTPNPPRSSPSLIPSLPTFSAAGALALPSTASEPVRISIPAPSVSLDDASKLRRRTTVLLACHVLFVFIPILIVTQNAAISAYAFLILSLLSVVIVRKLSTIIYSVYGCQDVSAGWLWLVVAVMIVLSLLTGVPRIISDVNVARCDMSNTPCSNSKDPSNGMYGYTIIACEFIQLLLVSLACNRILSIKVFQTAPLPPNIALTVIISTNQNQASPENLPEYHEEPSPPKYLA